MKKEERRGGKVPFPLKEGKFPGSNSAKVVLISEMGGGPGGTLRLELKIQSSSKSTNIPIG